MKIALYIEDGLEQIVLTPETKVEQDILAKIHDGSREMQLKRGSFYECRGGYMRHEPAIGTGMFGGGRQDDSTMIVLRPAQADRSGEAGETRSEAQGLDPQGESTVGAEGDDAPNPSSGAQP